MRNTDIILLIPLAWGAARGVYKGLISQLASLVGIVIAVYFAIKYYDALGILINTHIENKLSRISLSVATFVIIFAVVILLVFLLSKQVEKLTKALHIGFLNYIAGGLFGLLKWVFIVSVIILMINKFGQEFHHPLVDFHDTWVYNHIQMIATTIVPGYK